MSGFTHEKSVGGSVEWFTPKSVFDALGVNFDLDVCSPGLDLAHVPAKRAFTQEDDGLSQEWEGFVWCNPPYGRGIEKWLDKCAEHRNCIALVPSRTDTKWFQKYAATADLILFPAGRIRFHRGDKNAPNDGSPGVGNVFFAWGREAENALSSWSSSIEGLRMRSEK